MGYQWLLLLIPILLFPAVDAHALSRADILNMEKSIEDLKDDVIQYIRDIVTQRNDIEIISIQLDNMEAKQNTQKAFDRIANSKLSREALKEIEDDVFDKENELKSNESNLQSLINLKLNAENQILNYGDQVC